MDENLILFREAIEQEIDFIGQLYVEFEQLMKYPDIYDTPANLRSLVSLFRDFVDRIWHLIKAGNDLNVWEALPEKTPPGEIADELAPILARLFTPLTGALLEPFLRLYRQYATVYPDRIVWEEVVILAERFWKVSERVAGDLRTLQRDLLMGG